MEHDGIGMGYDLKMTVSIWKMTVSIWDILSLCFLRHEASAVSRRNTSSSPTYVHGLTRSLFGSM